MEFASFAGDPPKLHSWDGGKTWNTGGFSGSELRTIYDFCVRRIGANPTILETGAGNSTICFLYLKPKQVISIAPDQALFDRILDYCTKNGVSTQALCMHVASSEWVLPQLASTQQLLDLALLDGGHNLPTVMIDFFYTNAMLRKGGFMMVDDIQLHSVAELSRFIIHGTRSFRLVDSLGKRSMQIFEKVTDDPLGDWGNPYIEALSGHRTGPLVNRLINSIIFTKLKIGVRMLSETVRADAREGDIRMQLGEIAKANPEVAIGSYPFFDPQHGPNTHVVLRARDAQKLAQARRAVEEMLERVRRAQSNSA